MPIIKYRNFHPQIAESVFVAPNAQVIGQVTLGNKVSVFFGAVIRGDVQKITVGEGSNIQEHCVLHSSYDMNDCIVGKNCTIGHRAIIHGCQVGDFTLVGMGATILDNAEVGNECIIGAHALVTVGMKIPSRSLVLGMPAKVVRTLTDQEVEANHKSALQYMEKGQEYLEIFS